MTENTYRCVCHTCEIDVVIDGLEDAQEFFNDHTERAHEVELLNRETIDRYATETRSTPDGPDHHADSTGEDPSENDRSGRDE